MDTQLKALPTLPVLARTVSGCMNSAFHDISQHFTGHLFSPWIPSSACGIDGGPRRSTEVVLNEQCSKQAEAGGRSLCATVGSPLQTPGGFSEQPDSGAKPPFQRPERSGQPHSLPCRTMAWTRVWPARLAATVRPRKLPYPSIGGVSPDWSSYAIIQKALFRNGQGTRTSGWMWELPRRCRSSGRSEPWFRYIY